MSAMRADVSSQRGLPALSQDVFRHMQVFPVTPAVQSAIAKSFTSAYSLVGYETAVKLFPVKPVTVKLLPQTEVVAGGHSR